MEQIKQKQNCYTRVLLWIVCLWFITAFCSQALPATPSALPQHDHPRLLLFKGEENEIKQLIASDPAWKKMHEVILKERPSHNISASAPRSFQLDIQSI